MDFIFRMITPTRWRIMCLVLLVLAILCCVTSYIYDSVVFQNGGVLCLALAVGGTIGFWRCPRCRRVLPVNNMIGVEKCPKCRCDIRK